MKVSSAPVFTRKFPERARKHGKKMKMKMEANLNSKREFESAFEKCRTMAMPGDKTLF